MATKQKEETKQWLDVLGEDFEQGYEEEFSDTFTRDNIIKVSKDVTTKAMNVFIYDELENPTPEEITDVEPQSFKKLPISILSYKRNNTRFDGSSVVCGAISNIDGVQLASNKTLTGTNSSGETILCDKCKYNPWADIPEGNKADRSKQCRVGGYFVYLYAPTLGKVLRLTTSPTTSKFFREALQEITRLRKDDKALDGRNHLNAEYVVTLSTKKVTNKQGDKEYLGFTFEPTGEKWDGDKATAIVEGIKSTMEKITQTPVSKTVPLIEEVGASVGGQAIEAEIVNLDALDDDELPFSE